MALRSGYRDQVLEFGLYLPSYTAPWCSAWKTYQEHRHDDQLYTGPSCIRRLGSGVACCSFRPQINTSNHNCYVKQRYSFNKIHYGCAPHLRCFFSGSSLFFLNRLSNFLHQSLALTLGHPPRSLEVSVGGLNLQVPCAPQIASLW